MEKERFLVEVTVKGEGLEGDTHVREHGGCRAGRGCGAQPLLSARHAHRYPRPREEGQGFGGLTDGKERRLHGKSVLAR